MNFFLYLFLKSCIFILLKVKKTVTQAKDVAAAKEEEDLAKGIIKPINLQLGLLF